MEFFGNLMWKFWKIHLEICQKLIVLWRYGDKGNV